MKELTKKLYATLGLVVMLVICATGIASAQSEAANLYVKNVKNQALDQHKKTMMVPLSKVLEKVGHTRHITFVYESDLIEGKTVSKTVLTSANLGHKLGKLLAQNGLTYLKKAKGTYVIKRLPMFHGIRQPAAAAQVTGTVTDGSTGETLPGVNIAVKGTTTGTATDAKGQYELTVESLQDTLVFSFVGYQTRQVPINGRAEINVALQMQAITGQEMVVVGYGEQKKSEVTGSVSHVSGEDLAKTPSFNALQSLQGKATGVNIYRNSGAPTSNTRVIIRGMGSINASTDPLYVVDGVVRDNIDAMNPNTIESIEVLKGASSTAIYGSRGANGVILIKTKRGKTPNGGMTVEYNGNVSVGMLQHEMNTMNSKEFMKVLKRGYKNAPLFNDYAEGEEPKIDLSNDRLFDEQGNPKYDTNWQREATRLAISNNHQLSVRSGNDKSSFGAFLNYTDKEGIFLNTYMKRANIKLVFDENPKKWLSIGGNLSANRTWRSSAVISGGGYAARRGIHEVPPIFPVKWPDGTYADPTDAENFTFEGQPNPVHKLLQEDRLRDQTRLFGNVYVDFQFTPYLDLKTQFGIDKSLNQNKYYGPTDLTAITYPNGRASISNGRTTYWQNENYLTYKQDFGPHHVNAVLGVSWEQQLNGVNSSITSSGFPNDYFRYNNIGSATDPSAPTSYANSWSINSYFLRTTYSYKGKYTATLTGRADGSSRFGKNSKYGFFPSAGLSWVVSNEDFMSEVKSVDYLKVKTSYGVAGNTEIGLYNSISTVRLGTTFINGQLRSNSFRSRLPNPDLKWEKTQEFDVGMETDLFHQLLSLEVDYYHKLTKDLLLNLPVPRTTGFNSILKNIGSVLNEGVDFKITTNNIRSTNFSWSTTLNFNYNKNEVKSLGPNNKDILPGPARFFDSGTILRVGKPVSSFYPYKRLGTWNTDEAEEAAKVGKIPGEVKRSKERYITGKGLPNWTGRFVNNLNIGNFNINLDFQFAYGVEANEVTFLTALDRQGLTNGLASQLYDAWTPDHQNTMQPRIRNQVLSGQDLAYDDSWITNGSYLRAQQISVGYTFDDKRISSIGLKNLRISLGVQNAFVITAPEFKDYDPVGSELPGNNFDQNIFGYQYPKPRTITFSVNLQF